MINHVCRFTLVVAFMLASSTTSAVEPFTPLSAPATVAQTNEQTNPFLLPLGWAQQKVIDVVTLNGPDFFNGAYPTTFRDWDMIATDNVNGDTLFIAHETTFGSGMTRFNRDSHVATILLQGDGTATFSSDPAGWSHLDDDFGTLDPSKLTPWGTILTAEEFGGRGRLFELQNPITATGTLDAQWSWRSNVPAVAHEGLEFDAAGNLYFIDENGSGAIYKYIPVTPGDLSAGQTLALDVIAFAGNANEDVFSVTNASQTRTGAAVWVPITDANGNPLTLADPFDFVFRGGRAAADEVGATPFGRPEDLHIKTLANGHEVLFFAATDEAIVYSLELDPNGVDAIVREFVNAAITPDTLGNNPVGNNSGGTYGFRFPDNLAIDNDGDVFIVEDDTPGDIWVARDIDNDGSAEAVLLFASLGVAGSEPTGLIADPTGGLLVNVMHPSSDNDALWRLLPPIPGDADQDGIADDLDNCTTIANPDQTDTNADGFGNACDPDLNNDMMVDFGDLPALMQSFFSADGNPADPNWNPDADTNGDGVVDFGDLPIFQSGFFQPPGPSGVAP